MSQPELVCSEVTKAYRDGDEIVYAVHEVSLSANAGNVVAVTGPSGSGKTTLLHLLGGITHPDSGSIVAGGVDLHRLSTTEEAEFRALKVSFIFSAGNLLPVLTIAENLAIGLSLLRLSTVEIHVRTMTALKRVGLAEKAHRLPEQLSSGERQRVAIARALARGSSIIIADEPTAHLDHELTEVITNLLRNAARDDGACVLVATHDAAVAAAADFRAVLVDGRRVE